MIRLNLPVYACTSRPKLFTHIGLLQSLEAVGSLVCMNTQPPKQFNNFFFYFPYQPCLSNV